jgi:hypothetical protein
MESGEVSHPDQGTPQGGVVTPPTMLQKKIVSTWKRTVANTKYHINPLLVNLDALDQGTDEFAPALPVELF